MTRAEDVRLRLLATLEALPFPVERNREAPVALGGDDGLDDPAPAEALPRAILRDGTLDQAEPPTIGAAPTYFHILSARLALFVAGGTRAELDAQLDECVELVALAVGASPQLGGPGSYARVGHPAREDSDERGIEPGAAAELVITVEFQSQSPAG